MTARGPGGLVKKRVGETRWEIVPELAGAVFPLLEQLEAPVGAQDRRVFREDEAVTIFTIKTNRPGLAGELLVKVIRRRGLDFFRRSRSLAEWKMTVEHARRGLPAAGNVARGVRRRGFLHVEEYLIKESPTSYEHFDEFYRAAFRPELPGVRPQDKRRAIRELATLIRRMHDRGVSRPQIEPANIMAAPRSGGGVKLVFTDLDQAVLRKSRKGFSIEERVLELARFHKSFSPLFSQGYRIRFYRNYFASDDLPDREFRGLVKRIVDLSGQLARAEEPAVIRSIEKREPPFFWFRWRGRKVYMTRYLYQNSLMEAVEKAEEIEGRTRVRVRAASDRTPVELIAEKCGAANDLPARAGSAARWGFYASAVLSHHGISHFPAMAAVHQSGDGLIFMSMPGKGDYNLAEYLARRVAEEFSGLPWDRKFLIRVARFMLALHEAGWHFPRPVGDDLLVRYTDEGTHEIRVFNLHKLRRIIPGEGYSMMRNLFDLWCVLPISQADGLMLAEEYLRFCRHLAKDRAKWLNRFMEWQRDYVAKSPETAL